MPPPQAPPLPAAEIAALRNACRLWLNGHRPRRSMRDALNELAALPEAAQALDVYGEGALIAQLERDLATLLGKPAALFMHKGVAAQLAALRVWAGPGPNALVALHHQSHIEGDEAQAHEHLLGLRGARLGRPDQPFGVDALRALPDKPAVVTVELPLRRGGFRLPAWDELVAISAWCREQQVPLHVDGARLWESAPYYGCTLAEIAALADSVYLSFYKGLGGFAGCVLAGPEDFIQRVRPWQTRLAGNLFTLFPYVLAAVDGLRRHLPRMAEYHARAQRLAAALGTIDGVRVAPEPPQTNSFQLHLPAEPGRVTQALLDQAHSDGFWLGAQAAPSVWPGHAMVEVVVGDAADDWADEQAVAQFRAVLAAAG